MARPKIGDVIEIDTGQGLAYAHYSHQHSMYGGLLRVFSDLKTERPTDLAAAVAGEPTFMTFFPLRAAVSRGLVSIAGHVPLPERAKPFPTFAPASRVARGASSSGGCGTAKTSSGSDR